jgi:ABC-type uncharacterized transport system substrate-binding protein
MVRLAGVDPATLGLEVAKSWETDWCPASPAREGTVTGCSIQLSEISAKRLQLLTEAVPSVSRAAVLWNPRTPYHKTLLKKVEAAAPSLRLQPVPIAAQDPREFEGAFAAMAKANVNALFVADDPVIAISRTLLLRLAAKNRLPTIFSNRDDVTAGGLMSDGPRWLERFRTAAMYVDKILKGGKPADLPVDQAVKLELVVNLKTAKTSPSRSRRHSCFRRTTSSSRLAASHPPARCQCG